MIVKDMLVGDIKDVIIVEINNFNSGVGEYIGIVLARTVICEYLWVITLYHWL